MEPCVVVASSCSSVQVDDVVKGILGIVDLVKPLCVLEGIRSYPWTIKTKYYEANIQVCTMDQKTIGSQAFAESVNAVIMCFDSATKNGLTEAEQWLTFTKEFEADVKILLCNRCIATEPYNQTQTVEGISRLEAQTWCVSNGFELVELNPEIDCDSDVEDDFPESVGIERVIQALGAHLWPNMIMKGSEGPSAVAKEQPISAPDEHTPPPTRDDRIDAVLGAMESISDETFDGLFQNLSDMKLKAESMSSDERKLYAEKMTVAFWKSIGGNDSEIEDVSED